MGRTKQRLLLEQYNYNFHNDRFNKRNKSKGKKSKKQKYKEIDYGELYYWSREVRIIYNHACAYCGSHKLTTHHIFYKSKFPGLKYNLNNGIVLCPKHHNEVHRLNDIN